jgi:cytoplasmic FMR1 interacting protein
MTGAAFVANDVVVALEKMALEDGVPAIESAMASISYRSQTDREVGFKDSVAHDTDLEFTNFKFEMEQIAILEELLQVGSVHVETLYSFRSCARAIPQVEVGQKGSLKLYQSTFDLLHPEMEKLMKLREFHERVKECFSELITEMTREERKAKFVPDELSNSMMKVIDLLLKLDSLKDIKASVQNDLAQYKRATQMVEKQLSNSNMVKESIHKLQMFLASPMHPQSFIFHDLKETLQRIKGHDEVFAALLSFCLESLQQGKYATPNEKYRLIRSLPHLMLIIDGDGDDKGSTNVFKHPSIPAKMLRAIREMFKAHPVVPIYGDMALKLIEIIRRATHFNYGDMAEDWGFTPEPKVAQSYDLLTHWPSIRAQSSVFNTKFQNMVNEVRAKGGSLDNDYLANVAQTTKEGLRLLRDWVTCVLDMATWKYTNPASLDRLNTVGAKKGKDGQFHQYEMVMRYNFTKEELSVLVDCISMIKSLGSMMKKAESDLAPVMRNFVHFELQKYIQIDLLPMLQHLEKKAGKKDKGVSFKALELMRGIAADWKDGIVPDVNYSNKQLKDKAYLERQVISLPKRTVSHTKTQMLLVRSISQALVDDRYDGQKSSMFGSKDFDKGSEEVIRKFCADSAHFDRLLDYSSTVNELTDLSDLWYREFYLEMTKEVQFPIDMSLPWILTEHVIQNAAHSYSSSTSHMIESLLYVLTIPIFRSELVLTILIFRTELFLTVLIFRTGLVFTCVDISY